MTTVAVLFGASLVVRWVYLWMTWSHERDRSRYLRALARAKHEEARSRTPGGSTKTTGRGDPAGATPGGQARVGFAAPLACPAGTDVGVPQTPNAFSRACRAQAPVDGSVPAHLPSTGPTPAGAAATPPAPALAGPPPWRRYVHG